MKNKRPYGLRMLLAGAVLVALIALLFVAGRLIVGIVRGVSGMQAPDPQFAQPVVETTMPPDLFDENGDYIAVDRSAEWEMEEQAPVEKTADELIHGESE